MTIHSRHAQALTGIALASLLYLAPAAAAATSQPELPATDTERKAYATDICGAISANASPLRRNVTIDEVGNVAAFLLSDLASGMTGQISYVDCGVSQTAVAVVESVST